MILLFFSKNIQAASGGDSRGGSGNASANSTPSDYYFSLGGAYGFYSGVDKKSFAGRSLYEFILAGAGRSGTVRLDFGLAVEIANISSITLGSASAPSNIKYNGYRFFGGI